MDLAEKKKLANEKRLKAVQEWKKKQNQPNSFKAVQQNFVTPVKENDKGKLTLFDSDDEEDNVEHNFNLRPQFEGQSGQHLLEMSSQFSSRFKLDERFKDDDEPVPVREENEEKIKNIKILESILGYEVNEKYTEGKNSMKKKRIRRFDPEDENTSKYIKTNEISEEKPQKKNREKKKGTKEKEEPKEEIPTSSERYIEVSSNLKDLLKTSSSSPFTFTAKFSSGDDKVDRKSNDDFNTPFSIPRKDSENEKARKFTEKSHDTTKQSKNLFESKSNFTFFISEDDIRLKEGVEFFQRPKPMEEIREEWNRIKDGVLESFRIKRRSSQRGYVNKPNASQRNKTFIKK